MRDINPKFVVFFDGVCNLCNGFVRWIIKRDRYNCFAFTSYQSDYGKEFLKDKGWSEIKTIGLLVNNLFLVESDAVLTIYKELPLPWKWLYYLIYIPKPIRNLFYRLIAKNRYKLFGRKDFCEIPNQGDLKRFI